MLAARDGQDLPRFAIVALAAAGATVGVETLAYDELEPKLVARALRSGLAQRVLRREAERERGDVWSIGRRLTHDLRNPLGCIVTTAEMLKEILAEEAPAHVEFVNSILESTGEMLELINRVHFMAKASAQPRPPERCAMDGIVQAAVDRLQREISRRGAAVHVPEEWPEITGVRPWLEVVWANLLANALRHGGDPARIELGWEEQEGGYRFWVRDEGPGVPPERIPYLFTPFHQLHLRHGGGIGLSIVHRLVTLHGGRVGFEPSARGGARFFFTLPAVGPATPSSASTAAAAGHAR
ncbi:MAG TPA: HAMP domain-containing sensor histidine kinase [Candidatus Synoicihabitans sp.]|nr:HAMP domain-containing sensor histidine kinase [Candidatus Synoicihabitans sp.]